MKIQKRIRQLADEYQNWFPWIVGIVCVMITILPLFRPGFFRPHDFTHAARIVEMDRSLRAGEFPVRWSQNFGFGYGMPLFNFYGPLPYYVALIPYELTHNVIVAIKVIIVLNAMLAFVGMYLLGQLLWKSRMSGMLAATLFTLASYRAVDIYVRGALGEATAMVLIPFALSGILLMKSRPRRGLVLCAISLAAILTSHNLTGMISMGIVTLFGILMLPKRRLFSTLPIALISAIGLSAYYTLPAFFEKKFTRIEETITTGYFDYHFHFVALRQLVIGKWGFGGSLPGLDDGMSFALGIIPLVIFGCTLIGSGLYFLKHRRVTRALYALLIVSVFLFVTTLMTTDRSVFIWDHIGVLKYLQFPWRFLAFSSVFLSLAAGAITHFIPKHVGVRGTILALVLGAIMVSSAPLFWPETVDTSSLWYYTTEPNFIRSTMSETLNDYLPKEILNDHFPDPKADRLEIADPNTVTLTDNAPASMAAHVVCASNCELSVNVFQFPGWQAKIDGNPAPLMTTTGFPTYYLSVPSGDHDISVQLTDTPIRKLGNILSLVTAIVLIVNYVRYTYYKKL